MGVVIGQSMRPMTAPAGAFTREYGAVFAPTIAGVSTGPARRCPGPAAFHRCGDLAVVETADPVTSRSVLCPTTTSVFAAPHIEYRQRPARYRPVGGAPF
jgi:hypothetical protein